MTSHEPRATPYAPADPDGELTEALTPREAEVAALLGRMLGYKRIAALLVMSDRTVEAHVWAIGGKLPETEDALSPPERARRWAVCRAFWRGELTHTRKTA